ncbi:hypothetical protein [Micromonospora saelicesensis]|uniref:Uncharacterized protein n=1 Tax=Micromonospora saelicesensis TaxID=285676 RepID=A0A1C4ZGS1_9ACTN|nr:hypothetical protein [Micromonospora saelicesensis]RAO52104.1 hypothetical protein LUPAC06_05881 [Micromonospora saelicesensis]RAO60260.1 hypothetical protein PSN01_02089 [Micromonospora saelicesensis]SCF32230.1 hypothetical protein GA0070561_5325 [Micromonospora saelicesensis]
MRQEEQQVSNDHPEAVRSEPVPVPPAGDRSGRSDVPEDALDDRGTFDDRAAVHERADDTDRDAAYDPADDELTDDSDPRHRRDDRSTDEGGFHEPGPLPTTFGATTVADAVAASALASPHPQDQPDPRAERTAQPGDGAEDGEREGLRADPTAELHRRDAYVDDSADVDDPADLDDRADADTSARTVVPPGSTDGDPERRGDLTGDRDAAAAGAAGYGSATPEMVDPDADGEPVPGDDTSPTLESAGTSRPAGSTVAAEPATLLDTDTAQGFRDRWRDVQLRFVDDPQAAAGEAQSLVEEAIQALSSALAAQKNTLGGWQDAGSADTEQLRMAVRNYRDFLDRVLGR